jgi:hypothetical protein
MIDKKFANVADALAAVCHGAAPLRTGRTARRHDA